MDPNRTTDSSPKSGVFCEFFFLLFKPNNYLDFKKSLKYFKNFVLSRLLLTHVKEHMLRNNDRVIK